MVYIYKLCVINHWNVYIVLLFVPNTKEKVYTEIWAIFLTFLIRKICISSIEKIMSIPDQVQDKDID